MEMKMEGIRNNCEGHRTIHKWEMEKRIRCGSEKEIENKCRKIKLRYNRFCRRRVDFIVPHLGRFICSRIKDTQSVVP